MAKPPVRKPKKKSNPLAAAGVTTIDYKDTALLRKFISDRGKIRARRVEIRAGQHYSLWDADIGTRGGLWPPEQELPIDPGA